MKNITSRQPAPRPPTRKTPLTPDLPGQIDERDETIRLLNEALSLALDELNTVRKAA